VNERFTLTFPDPCLKPSKKPSKSSTHLQRIKTLQVKACLDELEEFRFLEAGLVYASEVRTNDRPLNSKELIILSVESVVPQKTLTENVWIDI